MLTKEPGRPPIRLPEVSSCHLKAVIYITQLKINRHDQMDIQTDTVSHLWRHNGLLIQLTVMKWGMNPAAVEYILNKQAHVQCWVTVIILLFPVTSSVRDNYFQNSNIRVTNPSAPSLTWMRDCAAGQGQFKSATSQKVKGRMKNKGERCSFYCVRVKDTKWK